MMIQFINRHRLKKKGPNAAISEAVEPIIYYLDNGTPEPVRSALLDGGRWWNEAFEAIGYKDAFQVKVLPDDAHPLDIRYNVINWGSSINKRMVHMAVLLLIRERVKLLKEMCYWALCVFAKII